MLSACNPHGEVQAAEAEPQDGPFFCCACHGLVILKQGHIKIPHFAHLPDAHCIGASMGESEEHQRTKLAIYQALLRTPGVTDVRLERYLEEVRPDVSFVLGGELVAVEIQLSLLTRDQIAWRTQAYAEKKVAVLWMPSCSKELFQARYAPADWERYLHTLYFGKVYYWLEGLTLQPVKFREYRLASGWYAGTRRSKRYVSPLLLPAVSLTDLAPVWRKPWRDWPRAKLWTEPWDDQ